MLGRGPVLLVVLPVAGRRRGGAPLLLLLLCVLLQEAVQIQVALLGWACKWEICSQAIEADGELSSPALGPDWLMMAGRSSFHTVSSPIAALERISMVWQA